MTAIAVIFIGHVVLITGIICYLRIFGPYLKLPFSCKPFFDAIMLYICSLVKREYAHKNFLRKTEEICRKYEKEGLFVSWLIEPVVFIFSPELVKKILNDPAAIYKPKIYDFIGYFLRNSIFLSNGEKWKRKKKIVRLAFQTTLKQKKIQIYNKHSRNLVKALLSVPNNTPNDIQDILRHSTLQIIMDSIFGIEKNFRERSLMIETLEKISKFLVERAFKPWMYPDFSLKIFPEGRACLKRYEEIKDMLLEMMETMKENMPKSYLVDMKPEFIGEALLKKHLEDPSFTMEALMAEILSLIIAAFDTTSLTLMWCFHLLGHHEEVQEGIISEVEEFNEELRDEDLRKMEYTDSVIRESLRIHATVPLIFKYLAEEVQCGKYTIPKGSTVALPLYVLHKNSDMFPDPEKFDPGRFWKAESCVSKQLYTASFSEGLRPCVGKVDALIQLRIMIAYVVRHFKIISLDKQKDVEVSYEIMLNTLKPLRMQFIPRCVE